MLIFPIVSVTFIKIQNGTIINVDDWNTNVGFTTDSSFKFESISNLLLPDIAIKYQLDSVPTSPVIFMIGENADGEEVRGKFGLRYRNSCDGENGVAVWEGGEMAGKVEDQLGVFCLANNGGLLQAPTISPVGTLSLTVRSVYILISMSFIAEYSLEYLGSRADAGGAGWWASWGKQH